jgi:hypothetical protein
MRFVFGIEIIAKGFAGVIKNHRKMRWLLVAPSFAEQLPQHIAEALDSTYGKPVALSREWWQCMICPENISGTINQIEVITGL